MTARKKTPEPPVSAPEAPEAPKAPQDDYEQALAEARAGTLKKRVLTRKGWVVPHERSDRA